MKSTKNVNDDTTSATNDESTADKVAALESELAKVKGEKEYLEKACAALESTIRVQAKLIAPPF